MQEGIQLPTIVVIGDRSSGKSSVLGSLAGIRLPIFTRVPLIMRLQNHPNPESELYLKFNGKTVPTDEEHIADAISSATEESVGKKGFSKSPMTLIVKKNGVPDLTMVDLPGITRVPGRGQSDSEDHISAWIYSKIIMKFILPEESIILNVLSADDSFRTCEAMRLSPGMDKTGQRTLVVVTKADKFPKVLEKVIADIGQLGCVCVRNRIDDESFEEARAEEARLFETHPLLSKIDKSIVGIHILAERLVKIQANIIDRRDIVCKINDRLSTKTEELNKLPRHFTSVVEAMTTFVHILSSATNSLRKILLRGEFDEYPDAAEMHCTARLAEMLNKYSEELQSQKLGDQNFLVDEIKVLEETKTIGLPNFLPHFLSRAAFLTLLQKKVNAISVKLIDFIKQIWSYIENVVVSVLKHFENYPQLLYCIRRAAKNLISKKKQQSVDWAIDIVEMEKLNDYTCNPEYTTSWNKLMSSQSNFMESLDLNYSTVFIDGFGTIGIAHLHDFKGIAQEAFDLKMRMTAYWDIVLRRMVDNMALHVLFSIRNLLNKEMQREIINEIMGPQGIGLERMLEESPSVSAKRIELEKSIKFLKESKNMVDNTMDRVWPDFD